MTTVRARLTAWDQEVFPAMVDVELDLADGSVALLRDKAPVFGVEPGVACDIEVDCRVVDGATGDSVRVELAHGIMSLDGRTEFTVSRDRLGE